MLACARRFHWGFLQHSPAVGPGQFPYTFSATTADGATGTTRPSAVGLRERLREGRQGQHEAVLAWIVEGARRWYAADRVLPPTPKRVVADTTAWRAEADLICSYIADRLIFDRETHVLAAELYEDFGDWIRARGHKPWADSTFSNRFGGHGLVEAAAVVKTRTRGTTGSLSRRVTDYHSAPAQ